VHRVCGDGRSLAHQRKPLPCQALLLRPYSFLLGGDASAREGHGSVYAVESATGSGKERNSAYHRVRSRVLFQEATTMTRTQTLSHTCGRHSPQDYRCEHLHGRLQRRENLADTEVYLWNYTTALR
jgi:hypothetical protein